MAAPTTSAAESQPSSIVATKGMQILGPQLVAAQQKDPEGFDLAEFLLRDEVESTGARQSQS